MGVSKIAPLALTLAQTVRDQRPDSGTWLRMFNALRKSRKVLLALSYNPQVSGFVQRKVLEEYVQNA